MLEVKLEFSSAHAVACAQLNSASQLRLQLTLLDARSKWCRPKLFCEQSLGSQTIGIAPRAASHILPLWPYFVDLTCSTAPWCASLPQADAAMLAQSVGPNCQEVPGAACFS